jgi:hypothetical protein
MAFAMIALIVWLKHEFYDIVGALISISHETHTSLPESQLALL